MFDEVEGLTLLESIKLAITVAPLKFSDGLHPIIEKCSSLSKVTTVLADIPTAENLSDVGTRPTHVYDESELEYRRERSLRRMNFCPHAMGAIRYRVCTTSSDERHRVKF